MQIIKSTPAADAGIPAAQTGTPAADGIKKNAGTEFSTPTADGFRMPAEYEPHRGTILIWPVRPGSWTNAGREAKVVFTQIAKAIAKSEKVFLICDQDHEAEVRALFAEGTDPAAVQNAGTADNNAGTADNNAGTADNNAGTADYAGSEADASSKTADRAGFDNIEIYVIPTNDSWARDIGPTCLIKDKGKDEENGEEKGKVNGRGNCRGIVRGINWSFNAWGGDYDGLYADYQEDDSFALNICRELGIDVYDAAPFVLEGGSIHSDGEGTVLVTETCLLSKGRNPDLSKEEIEQKLLLYLGAEKVIWLPRGIEGDETNEHVDNVCAFTGPGEVVLAWTDDENDQQWEPSNACLRTLMKETDAKGRHFTVHKMLIPEKPVRITQEELDALTFEEGEDVREVGERLAASYVNFYITNGSVLVPQFGDIHDKDACQLLKKLFPDREIIPIPARPIIVGGGNIHCITQQIPAGQP